MDDDDSFSFGLSASSYTRRSLGSDVVEIEDDEGEDEMVVDSKAEIPCPFCFDDFDMVGLYCHIDEEHSTQAESGVCPICSACAGMNIVGHMTSKHGDLFVLRRKLKLLKSETWLTQSLLRKDSLDGHLQSFITASSNGFSQSNSEPDYLLSSFVNDLPMLNQLKNELTRSFVQPKLAEETKDLGISERDVRPLSSSEILQSSSESSAEDHSETARKCEFVRGLLWSTFIDDGL